MNKKICSCVIAAAFFFSGFFPAFIFAADNEKYMISGMVASRGNDTPVKDAEVRVTAGDKEFFERTDAFGYYQIEGIDAGEYVEVAASKSGQVISPEVFRISSLNSNRTINFTASSSSESDRSRQAQKDTSSNSPIVISPSGKNSGNQDVPVVAKPASGVSQAQPAYVSETKPFFASGTKSRNSSDNTSPAVPKATFDLSGKVIYYASGLVGVKVMINNDRRMMTTTDINGYYSIKNIKSGQDYVVTFSRDGYIFDPSEYKIVKGGQDFIINVEANVSKHKIHGRVAEGRNGIDDVMIRIISGVDEFSTRTDSNGSFEIGSLSHGSNYFVTASKEGVMITPPKVIVNKLDNDRVINFNGVVQKFSISGTVNDTDGEAVKNAEIEFKTTFDTYKAVTNSKGKYVLDAVPMALTYTLTAGKEGYVSSEPVIVESLDRNREVNFQIKKEKEPKSTAKEARGAAASSSKVKKKATTENNKQNEKPARSIRKTKQQRGNESAADNESSAVKASETSQAAVIAASARDNKKEEKRLKAEREERERQERRQKIEEERLEKKRIAEQEELERREAEEAARQRIEEERLERKRIAEQEELERKEAEETARQKIEEERLERKRIAEQEELERREAEESARQRAEQERVEKREAEAREKEEKRLRAEEEKLEKKRIAEQEKLEKERKKEEERQAKLEDSQQAKKEKSETQKAAKAPSSRKKAAVAAVVAAEERPAKSAASSTKEKTVRVRGKIESIGGPLADIELKMSDGFTVRTDERGRYEFQVPAGRRYVLRPEATDFYFEPAEVVYDDLKSNAVQDFIPYITVEGEIFAEGRAVADVPVIINGAQAAVTNQFGKYKIEKIEYGLPLSISAFKNGVTFYPNPIEIRDSVRNHENVNFFVSYSLTGRITIQGSGVGLGNASVEVKGSTNTSVTTDFGGNFIILGLAQGGTFEIVPKIGGYSFMPPSRKFTDIRESFVGQNFSAVKETYTVKGNVNIGGKPIRNAIVSISRRALKYFTDDEGNFAISNLDYGGPYTINVTSNEHEFEPMVIDVLDKNMDIEFSTDISLGGIVVSGREPLAGIIVDVNGRKHKTDAEGKYMITGLKYNGDYLLSLATTVPGVIFNPSQKEYKGVKKSVLNEIFSAAALINGRVTFNGKPFAGAEVRLSGDPAVYKSDSNGYFLIQNVNLGQDYTLEVTSPGYKFDPPSREYKNLKSGKMAENFKASIDGMSIKGKVMAAGNPLKKVTVMIEGTSKARTVTNDSGVFVFDGLAPNKKYELTVLSKLHKFQTPSGIIEKLDTDKEITLEPGKVASGVSVGADPDTKSAPEPKAKTVYFRVSGKITVNGTPLKDVQVKSRADSVKTNAAGEYTISVKAGESVDVVPSLQGYVFSPEKLSLKNIKAAASNMNFTARSNTHTLEGHILNKDLKGVKGVSVKDLNSSDDFMSDSRGSYKVTGLFNKTASLIVPDSEDYNFYPENMEVSPESDITANDIYAYPKKLRKAEAFVYGGINSAVNISENDVSIVMVSPEGGRVSVKIKDEGGNIIKEFEPSLTGGKAAAIHWDGLRSNGSDAAPGKYSASLDGAGFKGEELNFRVFE